MSTLLRVCIVLLLPSFYQCVAEISASERKVLHSRQGGINFNQESIHNFNKRKLLRGPVEDTRNESVGQTLEFSVPALNTAATNSREAVENSILRGTTRRSHLYFGSRRTVGMPVHYPILCFTFIKRIKDYRILKRNMRMLGSTCDWAIAANLANGLRFNSMELDNFAKRNSVRLVHEDYRFTLANLTKIQLWKSVVSDLRDRYSHMWVLDGGMTLQDEHHYNQIVNDWQCGSVGGSPPLVSHPMIKVMGATKILPQSNYFNEYSTTDISMIGDTVVDDKAVLFDIGFLHWLFVEVMEPTIETEKDYSVFDAGLSTVWCEAGRAYINIGFKYMARAHGITDEGLLPIPCGMMVHPITDSSKIGENMKLPLEKTKRIIGKKLKALFPTWHNDFFRDERFPDLILQIDSDLQHVRNNEVLKKDISTKPKVMYRNTSQCSKQVVAVREGNLSVYVWS